MSTLEAAIATQSPKQERARLVLALANAAMAAIVGAWMFGAAAAAIGGLAMLLLPYLPFLRQSFLKLNQPNQIACMAAFCVLGVVAGVLVWGIVFAFNIALLLAPVMLVTICVLARANSLEA
jgi:hypothetical protein